MHFDHLTLTDEHRDLICAACGTSATRVFLAPMDKGLSRSAVWQARWELPGGLSKLHVFKIGLARRLQREERAVLDVASAIEPGFPLMRLYTSNCGNQALLRQEFLGDADGTTLSLRQYLQSSELCPSALTAKATLERLYLERLAPWHLTDANLKRDGFRRSTIVDQFPWWFKRMNLNSTLDQIGKSSVGRLIVDVSGLTLADLKRHIDDLSRRPIEMRIGPVHGDLHAQNVNLDKSQRIHIIDYGSTGYNWRAVDFLVMEFALRFVVPPLDARLRDLLHLDELIEKSWASDEYLDACTDLRERIHGQHLEKIAAGVCTLRRCGHQIGAITSIEDYLIGLFLFMASLTNLPALIHRVHLFASLAKTASMIATFRTSPGIRLP